jgi:hypothetical protein
MTALICLIAAAICALISRILLFVAAIRISAWWAMGVFLPFGPTLFRLNYPDEARPSFIFRVGTLGCVFLYLVQGPAGLIGLSHRSSSDQSDTSKGYGIELAKYFSRGSKNAPPSDPRTVDERRVANGREFERLNKWSEALRLRKRDLLRSDVEGNQAYETDLQEYNAALAAANAEKQALATASPAK